MEMLECSVQTREWLEDGDQQELSLVELVVAACEFSEDETEVADLVDGLIATGRVVVREAA
jgi:hypothetical protein